MPSVERARRVAVFSTKNYDREFLSEPDRECDVTDPKIGVSRKSHAFSKRVRAMHSTKFVSLTCLKHYPTV